MADSKEVQAILARGKITADDVLELRHRVFWKGVVTSKDAEMVFVLNDRLGKDADPSWPLFFVEALVDHLDAHRGEHRQHRAQRQRLPHPEHLEPRLAAAVDAGLLVLVEEGELTSNPMERMHPPKVPEASPRRDGGEFRALHGQDPDVRTIYETAVGTRPAAEPPRLFEQSGIPTLLLYGPEDHVLQRDFPARCEVAFTEWTGDGKIRHPSFQGLRADKKPAQVIRERPGSP